MSENRDYSGGQMFLAFLGGAVVGTIAALLLAPKSGKETRAQIANYIHDSRETLSRVPDAVRKASGAAKDAFSQSFEKKEG